VPAIPRYPLCDWDCTYEKIVIGKARYPLPLKSIVPLRPGDQFWIPIVRSVLADSQFIRPIWKPRHKSTHMRVEVVAIEDRTITLRKLAPPLPQRPHKRAAKKCRSNGETAT
jgi:hypothetical protein